MKKSLILCLALFSATSYASQCHVGVKNELHLDGQRVKIHRSSGEILLLDKDNRAYISGTQVALSSQQKSAVGHYRTELNNQLPKVKATVKNGMTMVDEALDEVADGLDTPNAFDSVKSAVSKYWQKIESNYYKDGELVVPADSYQSISKHWQSHYDGAKAVFNQEFVSALWVALSAKMQNEGGFNLSTLTSTVGQLQNRLNQRLEQNSGKLQQEQDEWCDSLDKLIKEEVELHKQIPELSEYQVFAI
jgi:hypothetical protein